MPTAVDSISPCRSSSATGDRQENVGQSASVTSFTVDTDAKTVSNLTPLFWDGPSHALDAVFMSFEQSERGNDSRPLAVAPDGEVSDHFSMPDLWMTDGADDGVTVPSESVRANWDELTSPAIALLLAAGYTGVTASVAEQTEGPRRSERFARPQNA